MLPKVSKGDILEGKFKVGIFPDVKSGDKHTFTISIEREELALRVHDGFGYMKESIYNSYYQKSPIKFGTKGYLSYQAVQYFPAPNNEVVTEVLNNAANSKATYNKLSCGSIEGINLLAVPINGEGIYFASNIKISNGCLVNRSPSLSKSSIKAFETVYSDSANPTCKFLGVMKIVQHTSLGKINIEIGENQGANEYIFAKGLYGVIPDSYWPEKFSKLDLVISNNDIKCSSSYTNAKTPKAIYTEGYMLGIVARTKVFEGGSSVAIDTEAQKSLGGDFDGDHLLIINSSKYPQLKRFITNEQTKEGASSVGEMKPTKTFTPAIKGNVYEYSRLEQILATRLSLLENLSNLMAVIKQKSSEVIDDLTKEIFPALIKEFFTNSKTDFISKLFNEVFGGNKYSEQNTKEDMLNIFSNTKTANSNALERFTAKGIYTATDSFKSHLDTLEFHNIYKIIKSILKFKGIALHVPYGKGLMRKIDQGKYTEEVMERDFNIVKHIGNFPAKIMASQLESYLKQNEGNNEDHVNPYDIEADCLGVTA